jgi:cellulose synthase/poly-beta-1,6-N-acetylglucosamine synthase-like glycosyltransferase
MSVSRRLFWGAVALVSYTYVGFPLLVLARARLRPRPFDSQEITPSVSVLIAAHNEARSIGAKIENLLGIDYPSDRFDVIVASDGSDDGTDAVVAQYHRQGVRLLTLERNGKAAALNAAAAAATGDILVFSDANSHFAPDALRRLVAPFADPAVGGVAGDQRYRPIRATDAGAARGERGYWAFERRLKAAESSSGNVISATGAIYAVRRRLFQAVPVGVTDDFATSTAVIAQGFRLVFAPDAIAWEPAASSAEAEYGRKVRIMTRGLSGVVVRRELLDPRRHGFYSLQLLSHKVLRRVMVVPLVVLAATSATLWRSGPFYRLVGLAQLVVYGLGIAGLIASRARVGRNRLLAWPAFFCMVNAASATAISNVVRGRRIDRWRPER